jgi:REP element-mobilizing transposase RayT
MSRPLRVEDPGAIYQLMCRGNARQRIFRDEADDQRLIDGLVTVSRFGWELFGFVLKPNHFYLLLRTPRANLSRENKVLPVRKREVFLDDLVPDNLVDSYGSRGVGGNRSMIST